MNILKIKEKGEQIMKKNVKIFSAVMAFSLALSSGAFVKEVSAAEPINCEFSAAEGKQGDTISLTFTTLSNSGTVGYQFELEYNKDVLELQTKEVDAEDDEGNLYKETVADITDYGIYKGFTNASPEGFPLVITAFDDLATVNNREVGKVFSVNFKIKEDAKPDTYTIKLTGNFMDRNMNDIEMNLSKEAAVKVECAHKSTHIDTKAADCINKGSSNTVCDSCGQVIDTKEIPALGHEFKDYTVTKEPACTEKGEETAKCTRCDVIDTREIAALGHKPGEWENAAEPSCIEKGSRVRKCTVCGNVTETEEIAALGHDFKDYTVSKEPSCEEKGEETAKCTRCDVVDIREIPALGHKFTSYKITKEPTETENGEIIRICTVCKKEIAAVIPALKDTKNEITDANGAEFQKTYEAGSILKFAAKGMIIANENPQAGDIRYIPVSWKIAGIARNLNEENKWENEPYTAEAELKEAGTYTLTVTFAREIYDAEKGWTADGFTMVKTEELQVTEKKQNETESETQKETKLEESSDKTNEKESAANKDTNKNNVKTGDAAPIVLLAAAAALAGTMIITIRKRNFR